MIDTHCHLNDSQFDNDLYSVINNFFLFGGKALICVGADFSSSMKAKMIAESNDNIYYTIGVHPDDCDTYSQSEMEDLILTKSDKLVAIGEIGLDYFHNKLNKAKQIEVFVSQINLAIKYNLPIVIHCRDAYQDVYNILKEYAPLKIGVVMHCYSGSLEFANQLIKLGVKLSFTGSVTFKNAIKAKEIVQKIPLDTFFFETDAPYLTPEPNRGKRNEPKNVFDTAKYVANLRQIDVISLIKITDENAKKFFNIKFT